MPPEDNESTTVEEVSQDDLSLSEALEKEWAAAEAAAAPAEDAPPASDEVVEEVVTEATSADDEPPPADEPVEVSPPEHWTAEDKEAFNALPGEAQQFYAKIAEHQKEDPEAEGLRSAFEPIRSYLQASGVPLTQAASTLVQTYVQLQQNPVDSIKQIAKAAQVEEKLREIYGNSTEVEDAVDTFVDPEIRALRKELREIKESQQTPVQANGPDQSVVAEIQRFRDEKGEGGELVHPHFDKVYSVMSSLVGAGTAKDLKDAYDQAVWTVPELREQQLANQLSERQKQAEEAAKAKAAKAKKAATTVNGKGSTTPEPPPPKTMGAELLENWQKSERGEL